MKIMTRLFFALFGITMLSAQIASVTNVTAAQRTDGSKIVDIYYDLGQDITFTTFTVELAISFDGGVTFVSTSHVAGDVGDGITAGTGKHIEWFLGSEYDGTYSNQTVIQVTATGRFIDVPFPFVVIPAGNFTYGVGDEIRNIPYDYEIMQYEVTNAEFAAFLIDALDAGVIWLEGDWVRGFYAGDENNGPGNYNLHFRWVSRVYWNGTTFIVEEGYGDHPVTGVTWFGAYKFASYYGLRLPTEEEWEKAARDTTGWEFPWGETIDSSNANYWLSNDPWEEVGNSWEVMSTTPAGFYNGQNYNGFQTTDSPSPFGVYDMAGNVMEWTADWDQNDPSRRIWKSGSFNHNQWDIQSYRRWSDQPNQSRRDTGFRCVRDISSVRAKYLLDKSDAAGKKSRQ